VYTVQCTKHMPIHQNLEMDDFCLLVTSTLGANDLMIWPKGEGARCKRSASHFKRHEQWRIYRLGPGGAQALPLIGRPPLFSLEFPVPQETSPPLFYLFHCRHFALQTSNCPFQTRPIQLQLNLVSSPDSLLATATHRTDFPPCILPR
jgi:hypothetical protein